jgi:hypothetical protein
LEHRVYEAWEHVVYFGEQQRKEAVIAVAEDGEQGHEVVEVVSWAELEGVGVGWKEGENICQGAGNVEEFLDLSCC